MKDGMEFAEKESSGFFVAIINDTVQPNFKYEGIQISPGFVANLGVTRRFYAKLPRPYGDCRDDPLEPAMSSDSTYYNYTLDAGGNYTRNQCYEICFQYSYAIPMCNCADPSINSNVDNFNVCHSQVELKCLLKQRSLFSSANCQLACPEACNRVEYITKVTMSEFPTR